ncbi:glycosyltransferase [Parabacteroides johnsonii]|uniref:Glycosyl transferase family 1 domain-containing protein n=1 Tax=Parabacteroides johnsonii CL02T12C29 TaxID=999419 RepID=K5ZIP5_9BACT|nr:glycosyltransferase [Parabacteroides johnsonii]EKN11145.1 hypothetical protein HMPREF1077_01403 [Parabacteroides johnsonii CL02T12C29]
MKVKEVTVFSEGDSLDLNCWSNVPYLFTKTLEKRGLIVNRVNIYSNKYIRKTVWKYLIVPVLSLFYKGNIYTFEQTYFNRFLTRLKIRRSLAKYKNSDLNIYMSYAYLENSKQPNVLFSDWTSEYVLRYRLNRMPFSIEEAYLKIQRNNIERADIVISLFPDIAEKMKKMYGDRSICYLGQNVINNVYKGDFICSEILSKKKDSNILLFVGRKNYLDGANMLIRVFLLLKTIYPNLELHIVGLSQKDFVNGQVSKDNGIYCYGYLDKASVKENHLYYDLLLKAKVFINPTPLWGGYSSTVEAMYFYNPIIVSNYSSFTDTFGEMIDFGYYVNDNSDDNLYNCICNLMECENYDILCLNSHERVKDFTWERFTDRFLEQVSGLKRE